VTAARRITAALKAGALLGLAATLATTFADPAASTPAVLAFAGYLAVFLAATSVIAPGPDAPQTPLGAHHPGPGGGEPFAVRADSWDGPLPRQRPDNDAARPLYRRILGRLSAAAGRRTSYGWDCPPCRINAGHPENPFPTRWSAEDALAAHIYDSHNGAAPAGAWAGEVTWRGRPPQHAPGEMFAQKLARQDAEQDEQDEERDWWAALDAEQAAGGNKHAYCATCGGDLYVPDGQPAPHSCGGPNCA